MKVKMKMKRKMKTKDTKKEGKKEGKTTSHHEQTEFSLRALLVHPFRINLENRWQTDAIFFFS